MNNIHNFFILSVILAPLIEEALKPLGLPLIRSHIDEIEDGLIYGAITGLGFAATENLVYGMRYWNEGLLVLISLFYLRTIGSSMLHASASALTGYGYSKKHLHGSKFTSLILFYLLAVGVHVVFNFFSYSSISLNHILGVVIAVCFAVSLMMWIRTRIILFDQRKIKNISFSFFERF